MNTDITKLPVILIVEDSPTQAARIRYLLENNNYRVEVSVDGQKALNWLSKNKPSLVISDIVMPGMNGFELCEKIKSDKDTVQIPVILLTSLCDPDEVIEGLACGADRFLTKPYNNEYLLATIIKTLADEPDPGIEEDTSGIEIRLGGKKRHIHAGQQKVFKFLLNIYEGAIQQNGELIQTRDELRLLNEKLEELVNEKTQTLEVIEFKNSQIKYSIDYAYTIQAAILKSTEKISVFFPMSFSLTMPKDTVSGDFYWCHKIDNTILVGVFDCTGHGIPGAFMSILGLTLLKETVVREGIVEPSMVLNRMRIKIIESLGQKGVDSEVNVGMNGSIISFDQINNKLVYAGAYNRVYIVREEKIIELKVDSMPLSHHLIMKDFESKEVKTMKDDCVYLFTDGYMDQFGGQKLKKFGYNRFRDLLLRINKSPFKSQKQALTNEYTIWRESEDQVDDITIIGLKL
jgi:DNA-binding response OmpR family regulator